MFIFRTIFWGTVLVILTLVVGPWLAVSFEETFPQIDLGWGRYIGVGLGLVGITVALFAGIYLIVPGLSRSAPYEAGGSFSLSGPYKYVRNPFMCAVILMLWGEALFLNSIVLIFYAFLCTWILHAWVVFFEEPSLRAKLKDPYLDYHKQVPRWIPRLKGYRPTRTS